MSEKRVSAQFGTEGGPRGATGGRETGEAVRASLREAGRQLRAVNMAAAGLVKAIRRQLNAAAEGFKTEGKG